MFGGGSLHGLTLMGHFSTAFVAGSITALDAGLFRTSPFPALLVCSSALSEVVDWCLVCFGVVLLLLFVCFPILFFLKSSQSGRRFEQCFKGLC